MHRNLPYVTSRNKDLSFNLYIKSSVYVHQYRLYSSRQHITLLVILILMYIIGVVECMMMYVYVF